MGKRTRYTVRTKTGVHEIEADYYTPHFQPRIGEADFLAFSIHEPNGGHATVALIRIETIEAIFFDLPKPEPFTGDYLNVPRPASAA
jgi:hypothetical protein